MVFWDFAQSCSVCRLCESASARNCRPNALGRSLFPAVLAGHSPTSCAQQESGSRTNSYVLRLDVSDVASICRNLGCSRCSRACKVQTSGRSRTQLLAGKRAGQWPSQSPKRSQGTSQRPQLVLPPSAGLRRLNERPFLPKLTLVPTVCRTCKELSPLPPKNCHAASTLLRPRCFSVAGRNRKAHSSETGAVLHLCALPFGFSFSPSICRPTAWLLRRSAGCLAFPPARLGGFVIVSSSSHSSNRCLC